MIDAAANCPAVNFVIVRGLLDNLGAQVQRRTYSASPRGCQLLLVLLDMPYSVFTSSSSCSTSSMVLKRRLTSLSKIENLCYSKVPDLNDVIFGQQNVHALEISMYGLLAMEISNSEADLKCNEPY